MAVFPRNTLRPSIHVQRGGVYRVQSTWPASPRSNWPTARCAPQISAHRRACMESHRALRTMHWLISGADRDIESRRPGQGYVDVDIYELYGACVLATAAPQAPQTPQNRASEFLPTGQIGAAITQPISTRSIDAGSSRRSRNPQPCPRRQHRCTQQHGACVWTLS